MFPSFSLYKWIPLFDNLKYTYILQPLTIHVIHNIAKVPVVRIFVNHFSIVYFVSALMRFRVTGSLRLKINLVEGWTFKEHKQTTYHFLLGQICVPVHFH